MRCVFTNETQGNPPVAEYLWLKDGHIIQSTTDQDWITFTISSIGDAGNYSCFGTNYPLQIAMNGTLSEDKQLTVYGKT